MKKIWILVLVFFFAALDGYARCAEGEGKEIMLIFVPPGSNVFYFLEFKNNVEKGMRQWLESDQDASVVTGPWVIFVGQKVAGKNIKMATRIYYGESIVDEKDFEVLNKNAPAIAQEVFNNILKIMANISAKERKGKSKSRGEQ